ncbi:hypothetical protein CEUSTIGMA_g123.t1 [Chlamydomonas eustigma]|uniref:Uncharacterized protein n=1 Tax=Chlamydomonas eustigma TaxID=1157962 RepID=A0A250WPA6_9CHLO|nr:hypothetical protein CEUSTIGMA_g123.t1 [Chlamydomonas eustigma]|eukprot:GAX72667.1 hypothetical protein CEUSTIGMA_g123.t1 [Chlamydomonas eustigma]
METVVKLKGHHSSVSSLSCTAQILASGDEDGWCIVHDVGTEQVLFNADLKSKIGLPAVTSGAADDPEISQDDASVSAVCWSPSSNSVLFTAVSTRAFLFDLRAGVVPQQEFSVCKEDIVSLDVNTKGTFLSLADDSGAVQVVDLTAKRVYKSLRQAHSNICSSVTFRRYRPWELVSGGLDMTVARWDFSRAKELCRWSFGSGSGLDGNDAEPQMFNPPMVHQVALGDKTSEDRSAARLAAAVLGNGAIALFDVDSDHQASTGAARSEKKNKGSTTKQSTALKDISEVILGVGLPCTSTALPGLRMELGSSYGGHTASASCCCFIPGSLDLMEENVQETGEGESDDTILNRGEFSVHRYADSLGKDAGVGSHSASTSYSFKEMMVASGGDDRRILLWSIPRAVRAYCRQQSLNKQVHAFDLDDHNTKLPVPQPPSLHPLVLEVSHKRKVNALNIMQCSVADKGWLLNVADTSKNITCYRFKHDHVNATT